MRRSLAQTYSLITVKGSPIFNTSLDDTHNNQLEWQA